MKHKLEHGPGYARAAAVSALAAITDKTNYPFYTKVMCIAFGMLEHGDSEQAVRDSVVRVCSSLVLRGDQHVLALLFRAAHSQLPAARQAAVEMMRHVCHERHPHTHSLLLFLLKDSDWGVRRMAALASALLASPSDERIMQGLLLVLEDEEPYVREAAKLALSNLRRHQPVS